MSRLTTSAAALALAAGFAVPAAAEMHMSAPGAMSGTITAAGMQNLITGDLIEGADIYAIDVYDDNEWLANDYFDEVGANWEEVGEIEELVISADGKVVGVVAEVGGWLDIGDSDVIISFDDLRMVRGSAGEMGWTNVAFVTRLTEAQIESLEDRDTDWW